MSVRLISAAAFAVACSISVAATPDATTAPRQGFSTLDRNADGVISRDEAAAHPRLAESFDRLDANKDGALSADELRAARRSGHGHAGPHARLDTNNDGSISRDEAKASPRMAENFDAMDLNKDGTLTRDELMAWRKAHPRPTHDSPAAPAKPQ